MPGNCQLSISHELYSRIEKRIRDSKYGSVELYVAHILREVLSADEDEHELLTSEQQDRITERLRDLGYLD